MENDKKIIAEVIVDLYEMRISTMNKYQDKHEKVLGCAKYNFFTSAIAVLCDKYKIQQDLIEEICRKRSFAEKTNLSI